MMTHIKHYHDWLRDAHAMEKQAESMLISMAKRIDHYPDLKARIERHIDETKHQISVLEEVLDRNHISSSMLKDAVGKMTAFGQTIGGMLPSDEIVKGGISGYVFEQFEIACYTTLIAAAKKVGDHEAVSAFESVLDQEKEMADWLLTHLPDVTEKFLSLSESSHAAAKK